MDISDAHISFFLKSNSLDPESVTAALKLTPTHIHASGTPRTGRLTGMTFKNSIWLLESDLPPDASLDAHLRRVCEQLLPRADVMRALLRAGWTAEFRCGIFLQGANAGSTIQAETVSAIGRLGSALALDIYPGGDDDDEDDDEDDR